MKRKLDLFKKQLASAEGRYARNAATRKRRKKYSTSQHAKGDWQKVDSPERIMSRLKARGKARAASRLAETDLVNAPEVMPGKGHGVGLNLLERILGENDLLGASFLPVGARVTRSVGRIITRSTGFGFGTGFMVSDSLLMTNNHVFETLEDASTSAIQFDFFVEPGGNLPTPTVFEFDPQRFFLTDEALDYSLVAVSPQNVSGDQVEDRGWSPLIRESGKALVTELVNIIQHPGGEPQQLAIRENEIIDVVDEFLHYQADTEPGSSGSPVFNDQWELAALHHSGVPARDAQGRILLVTGEPWPGTRATIHLIRWVANEGVRISSIASHLDSREGELTPSQRSLLSGVFEPAPERERTSEGEESGTRPVLDESGEATWIVPLRVRVGLGSTNLPIDTTLSARPTPEAPAAEPEDTEELQRALAILEDSSDLPYYDLAADEQAHEEYYATIPDEAGPDDFYRAFRELVRDTHSTLFSYRTARLVHLYPRVDLHKQEVGSSRELRSIYSGRNFDPQEILAAEVRSEQMRERRLHEVLATEGALSEEALEAQLDLLEASFPFNCEHVVPQSWFNKARPMVSDLHHLFACEPPCNSFRSNIPYFNFPLDVEEVERDMCGRREQDRFEPEAGKGPVSRATLYFLLRYPGMIGDEARELQRERLEVLLKWNEENPPDIYEFHRNAEIHAIQGNRNPAIDFSPMLRDISFELGFGE